MATTPQIGDPNYKPGGLISVPSSGPQTTGYNPATATASQAKSTGYDPKATTVQSNDTVQGQIKGLIDLDSPLMQQAQRRAMESANARGQLNSSLAIGAAQGALYDAALPIATSDANTYFTANQKTVDATNAARNFGAAAENQASLATAQLGTDVSKTNAGLINEASARSSDAANQASLAQLDVNTRKQLAQQDVDTRLQLASLDRNTQIQMKQMDIATQTNLAQMENQYRQLIQANQNLSSMFQQTVAAMGNISMQPNLSKEAKDAAIATQLNSLREALAATADVANRTNQAVTGLNLGKYFDTTPDTPSTGTPYSQQQPSVSPNQIQVPTPLNMSPGSPDFNNLSWAQQATGVLQSGLKQNDLQLENGQLNINPDTKDTTIRVLNLYQLAKNGDASAQSAFRASSFGYPNPFLDANVGYIGGRVPGNQNRDVTITQL